MLIASRLAGHHGTRISLVHADGHPSAPLAKAGKGDSRHCDGRDQSQLRRGAFATLGLERWPAAILKQGMHREAVRKQALSCKGRVLSRLCGVHLGRLGETWPFASRHCA